MQFKQTSRMFWALNTPLHSRKAKLSISILFSSDECHFGFFHKRHGSDQSNLREIWIGLKSLEVGTAHTFQIFFKEKQASASQDTIYSLLSMVKALFGKCCKGNLAFTCQLHYKNNSIIKNPSYSNIPSLRYNVTLSILTLEDEAYYSYSEALHGRVNKRKFTW